MAGLRDVNIGVFERMKNLHQWITVVLTTCCLLGQASLLWSACTPGQLQSYFYGVVWGQKFEEGHELRGYIDGLQVGTTNANPGRLDELNDRVEFALYLCGESSDVGKTVEFRYARGNLEYQVNVSEGYPSFQGREIEVGAFPELEEAKLLLEVTGKKVVILADEESATEDEGETAQETSTLVTPDVNNDGRIDSNDAAIVLNHILFPQGNAGKEAGLHYDINSDGVVNTEDVKEIYRRRH